MAAYTYNVSFRGQKLTRRTTSTTEDSHTFTVTNPAGGDMLMIQAVPTTVGLYYHSTAAQSQTDGYPIAAGQAFTLPAGGTAVWYTSAQTGSGTLDFVVI